MSLKARTGRLRQRYDEDNLRLVSGCIPYRLTKDADNQNDDIENRIEVAMVSSPKRNDLVFPKGGWEDDETLLEAASREALEEAGVKGILNENPLGVWEFRSKSRQDLHSLEGGCRGYMFALQVTEELEIWPEQESHYRKWLNIKDAFQLCRYEWMREALKRFLGVMSEERKMAEMEEEVVETQTLSTPQVSDVIADCQIMTPNCCVATTGSPHHSISSLSSFLPQISLFKRLPLS